MVNIRQKGANGEREIYNVLNPIVQNVLRELNYPSDVVNSAANAIQRNQNQSAVGGNDLTNTFGMSIEVKRQEQLSINSWWKQCLEASERNKELPVLLYRQNNKKWQCVTLGWVDLFDGSQMKVRLTMDWDTFLMWFENWVKSHLTGGGHLRI